MYSRWRGLREVKLKKPCIMKSSNQTSKTNPTLMIDQYQQEMKMRKTVYSINPFYHGTSDRKKKITGANIPYKH